MRKEKQIEEMADDIDEAIDNNMTWHDIDGITNIDSEGMAKELMTKGYRKQSEGHNAAMYPCSSFECSICHFSDWDTTTADTSAYNFCPNCGAHMRGGKNE
jgi:rubrerythrin